MAQTQYRANLAAKDFAFIAQGWGRSVIVKQFDQNFSRQIVSPTDPDKDIGTPQIFYCHNVMPSSQGFQSVGILPIAAAPVSSDDFYQILPYTATGQIKGYIGAVLSGDGFDVYDIKAPGDSSWSFVAHVTSTADVPSNYDITQGNAGGINYFWFPYTGCFTYDGTTWAAVTLSGLLPLQTRGITDSFGYLIAWSNNTVAWSSTIDPTDFNPSLITGAGGGSVEGLLGDVVHCAHHVYGFVAFSTTNAVAAVYSGNSRYPFNFRALVGSGGLSDTNLLGVDPDTGNLFAWTTRGLQLLSTTAAVNVHPELVNFIGGSRFEDFNEVTNTFIETDVTMGSMGKGLQVISNRYLVISYGLTYKFTHALVFDITMKRWGKIRIDHVKSFEFALNSVAQEARTSLAFVDQNGLISIVDFSYAGPGNGILILGKFQHTRSRWMTMQEVDVEGIFSPGVGTVWIMPTLDGKTFQTPQLLSPLASSTYPAPTYPCRVSGLNISLLFKGGFNLDCIVLSYIPSGRR